MKKHVPNGLTLGNLLSGCLGIYFCFSGELILASGCILLGAVFDFFDGFTARLLGVSSPIGKELDSLADMVTFGLLPGFILFQLMATAPEATVFWPYLPFVSFLVPVFSALRLAKFNIDTRQADGFIGVPTPANAMLIAALPYIKIHEVGFFQTLTEQPVFLSSLAVVMSLLLVAEIPLIALKFKHYKWEGNQGKYLLVVISIILFLSLGISSLPIIVFLYIFLSILQTFVFRRSKGQQQ